MSQRTAKVESYIQQSVARGLLQYLGGDMARFTVTRVDVSPDLHHAIIWVGIVAETPEQTAALLKRVQGLAPALQHELAGQLTLRQVPRLEIRHDTGAEQAAELDRLLKGL